jgi:hypothetical protein
MGREVIGECLTSIDDPSLEEFEREAAIRFIRHEAGISPLSAVVQIGYEDSDYGSYPVIVVVWDDYEIGYPERYIEKCIDAFDRFEVPEEILERRREQASDFRELNELPNSLFDRD